MPAPQQLRLLDCVRFVDTCFKLSHSGSVIGLVRRVAHDLPWVCSTFDNYAAQSEKGFKIECCLTFNALYTVTASLNCLPCCVAFSEVYSTVGSVMLAA